VTALLDAIARVFVAPRAQARLVEAAPAAAVRSAAVCGPAAEPLACVLALLLRRRGPAVVCAWGAAARRAEAPTTAGARRLAASMAARGLTARATGRLVVVTLDTDGAVAAAEAGRAAAAAGEAPVVLALAGPRDDAFDSALAAQDVAVVAAGDAPEELVRLAVATLGQASRAAVAAAALSGAAAWSARAGLWAGPAARRAVAPAIEALGGLR
jgi:hypothetical protein